MKYLRRLVWYLASKLFIIVLVLGLFTISFYFSMNMSNIYIILKDGMALRAQTVLVEEDPSRLDNYFSPTYLLRDPVLNTLKDGTNPYVRYDITGIDHRLKMEWMWSWPWEDTARATVVESIPRVDGRIRSSYKATTPEEQWPVPKWQSGRYDIVLTREGGRWRIKNMVLTQVLQEP
ncbi:MAG: hypothetical protein Q4E07_02805 [Eubacteriales bacterium]|nr:hypothetical protein [Eubacteriales bacterium]